jgi:hypothetical protein
MRVFILVAACLTAGWAPAAEWSEGSGVDWTVARHAAMRDVLEKSLDLLEKNAPGAAPELRKEILATPEKYARVADSGTSEPPAFGMIRARFLVSIDAPRLLQRLRGTPLCGECCRKPVVLFSPGGASSLVAKGLADAPARFEASPAGLSGDSASGRGADFLLQADWTRKDPESSTVYGAESWTVPVDLSFRLESAFARSLVFAWDSSSSRRSADRGRAEAASKDLLSRRGNALLLRALDSAWSDRCFTDQPAELHISASGGAYPPVLDKIAGLPEVTDARPRYWGSQGGVWDLAFRGPFPSLLKALRELLPGSFEGVDGNRIRFRFAPGMTASAPLKAPSSEVEITSSDFPSLFSDLRKTYSSRPYWRLNLKNSGRSAIEKVRLTVSVDGIAGCLFDTLLTNFNPSASKNVPISLTFPAGSLEYRQHSNRAVARVSLRYPNDPRKEDEFQIPVWIHPPKVFQWTHPMAICSYISSKDPSIDFFLRQSGLIGGRGGSALFLAAKTYEALRLRGINYQRDPKSRVGREGEMDEIQYPPETLLLKTGDCDDLALLYATLLTALGMETNLLVYPDHILVMVLMDVPPVRSAKVSADPGMVVIHGGRAWIAVETTLLGRAGFLEAWKAASEQLNAGRNEGMVNDVIDPMEGWADYPSADWNGKEFKAACDSAQLEGRLEGFARDWDRMNRAIAAGLVDSAGSKQGIAERIAIWGDRNSLKEKLQLASAGGKTAPRAFNNMGNLEFMGRHFEAASADYRMALRLDPSLPGVHANLALSLGWGGSMDSARAHLRESAHLYGSARTFMENMGWILDQEGRIKSGKKDSSGTAEDARKLKEIERMILQVKEGFGDNARKSADTMRIAEEAHPVGEEWKDILAGTEGGERMLWWY